MRGYEDILVWGQQFKRRGWRRAGMATGVSLALVLVGCGGASRSEPAKDAFVAKANVICAADQARLHRAERSLLSHKAGAARVAAFVRGTAVPAMRTEIDAIQALTPPPGARAGIARMLGVALVELRHLEAGSIRLGAERGTFSGFARLAHTYGLTACLPQLR
jgi:hypothetical protein